MFVGPGVQVKTVKGNTLGPNADHCDARADFAVEAVFVHAQVLRGVSETYESRSDCRRRCRFSHAFMPSRRRSVKLTLIPCVQFLRADGGRVDRVSVELQYNYWRVPPETENDVRVFGR
jgi:hypothetical protein